MLQSKNIFKFSRSISRMYSSASSSEIEFNKINNVASITLNRPKQLNALNLPMVKLIHKQLDIWEKDDEVRAIVIKGSGDVAFCAGGDVKQVRADCLNGKRDEALEFFREEYKLNYRIANLNKPYIALLNGVTMGGGVGLSVHGKYRVATEKTLFAMPETAIGFFADVGGSYFLSRLNNNLGIFLVLTGNRIKGQDNKRVGIATHYVSKDNLASLETKLNETSNLNDSKVENIITNFNESVAGEYPSEKISEVFSASTVEEMISRLEKENTDWSAQQLKLLNKMSPLSLKVAIKQLNNGLKMNLKNCLEMEYVLGQRFLDDSDFFEGVRALLVNKGDKPTWKPKTFGEVTSEKVDWFFKDLPSDEKLILNDLKSNL